MYYLVSEIVLIGLFSVSLLYFQQYFDSFSLHKVFTPSLLRMIFRLKLQILHLEKQLNERQAPCHSGLVLVGNVLVMTFNSLNYS
jgi:hypothetical protein